MKCKLFSAVLISSLSFMLSAPVYAEQKLSFAKLKDFHETYFASNKFFTESLFSVNTKNNQMTQKDEFMALEQRMHFETIHYPDYAAFLSDFSPEIKYSSDILIDGYTEKIDYETREFSFFIRPTSFMDLKMGKQILTWGTGDYLFINDMFAKDYISFFTGRDDQYLKKPQDAVRTTIFNDIINIDYVLLTRFTPNTTPTGKRLSFYDGFKGQITGITSDQHFDSPTTEGFSENEHALRLYKKLGRYETALYFFDGFYKNPRGYFNNTDTLYYPPVEVYGVSLRGPLFGGIANLEGGYLISKDDREGDNRMVENSMLKYMGGYSYSFESDLMLSVQYYVEKMKHYDSYKNSLLPQDFVRDEINQLITLQAIQKLLKQTLTLKAFLFYSPTDEDFYFRSSISYKATDRLDLTLGANIFLGKDSYTQFGQHEENDNIYIRLRYGF